MHSFSGFSAGSWLLHKWEKVICYQLWDRKITCQRFDWVLLSPWWWLEHSVEISASYFPISKLVTDNLFFHLYYAVCMQLCMLAYNDDMHPIYSGSQLLVQLAGVSVDGLLILLSAGQPDIGMGIVVSQSASREAQISSLMQCIHTHSMLLDCVNLGHRAVLF